MIFSPSLIFFPFKSPNLFVQSLDQCQLTLTQTIVATPAGLLNKTTWTTIRWGKIKSKISPQKCISTKRPNYLNNDFVHQKSKKNIFRCLTGSTKLSEQSSLINWFIKYCRRRLMKPNDLFGLKINLIERLQASNFFLKSILKLLKWMCSKYLCYFFVFN